MVLKLENPTVEFSKADLIKRVLSHAHSNAARDGTEDEECNNSCDDDTTSELESNDSDGKRTHTLKSHLGSRDGAVVEHLSPMQASHQCGPGSIPGLGVKCGLSLLLVLVLAPRGFSPGTPVFPSPQKPTFPNSN